MATPELTPERLRQLQLQAQAEIEIEMEMEREAAASAQNDTPAGSSYPGMGGAAIDTVSELAGGGGETVSGLINSPEGSLRAAKQIFDQTEGGLLGRLAQTAVIGSYNVGRGVAKAVKNDPLGAGAPIAGNAIGGFLGGPPGAYYGGAAGGFVGSGVKELLDSGDPYSAYKAGVRGAGRELVLPAAAKVAGATINAASRLTPKGALYAARNSPNVISGRFGAGSSNAEAQTSYLDDLARHDPEIMARSPELLQGADPAQGTVGFDKFRQNIIAIKEQAIKDKDPLLSQGYTVEGPNGEVIQKAYEIPVPRKVDLFTNRSEARTPEPEAAALRAEARDLASIKKSPLEEANALFEGFKPPTMTLREIEDNIAKLGSEAKGLGAYDPKKTAGATSRDPIADAAQAQAKTEARDYLVNLRNEYLRSQNPALLSQIEEANRTISALADYEELTGRFRNATGGVASERPASTLISTLGGRNWKNPSTWLSPKAGRLSIPDATLSGSLNDFKLLSGWANKTSSVPLLSRNWDAFKAAPGSTIALNQMAAMMGMNPDMIQSAPEPVQRSIVRQAMKMNPEAFESNSEGYKTVMDDRFDDNDPMEGSMYLKDRLQKARDGQLSIEDEPNVIGQFLSSRKYTPPSTQAPMSTARAPVQFELSDADMALNYGMSSSRLFPSDSEIMRSAVNKFPPSY